MAESLLLAQLVATTAIAIPLVFSMEMRDQMALDILSAIIQANWQFLISEEKDWDQNAVEKAYKLADLMLKEREIKNVC